MWTQSYSIASGRLTRRPLGQTAGAQRLRRWVGPAQPDESAIVHAALGRRRGVMLDVGAHSGYALAPFAADGWSVHAFEPDPANRAKLAAGFGNAPNVTIVPKAVSDQGGEGVLFTSEISTGISSLTPFTESHNPSGRVPIITMRQYLAEAGLTAVDFMKIDVEGFERNVLSGYNWAIRPEVIVLEFEDFKTIPLGYSWKDLADALVEQGYQVLVSEWFPVERYGGSHRWRRMERYPTELIDAAAWGNLIATTSVEQILGAAERAVARCKRRYYLERVVRPRSALPVG